MVLYLILIKTLNPNKDINLLHLDIIYYDQNYRLSILIFFINAKLSLIKL